MQTNEKKVAQAKGLKRCPQCAEYIQPAAKVCRYYQYKFPELTNEEQLSASGITPGPPCPSCAGVNTFSAMTQRKQVTGGKPLRCSSASLSQMRKSMARRQINTRGIHEWRPAYVFGIRHPNLFTADHSRAAAQDERRDAFTLSADRIHAVHLEADLPKYLAHRRICQFHGRNQGYYSGGRMRRPQHLHTIHWKTDRSICHNTGDDRVRRHRCTDSV